MKNLVIRNRGITSPTIFENDIGGDKHGLEPVLCAFDLSQTCSPNCAACDIVGSGKVYCSRGVKDDFCIGIVKED